MRVLKRGLKAQVSVFVILAIVIVGVGVFAYFISKGGKTDADKDFFSSSAVKPQFENIKTSVYDCMKYTCVDALDLIGTQGGYYKEPKEYFDLGWAFIPYYYKEGQFLMPQKSKIESELSKYVDDNIGDCISNINIGDFEINYSRPKTITKINKKEVEFKIDMPVSIKKQDKTTELELKDSPVSQPSKLYEILEIAKYITDSHKEDSEMICVNCVADMASERNVYVNMMDFGKDSTVLVFLYENMTSANYYSFEFLNKYPKK